jgi:endonuclease/exonuclease/phosphatase family metal-dependent hydrolase
MLLTDLDTPAGTVRVVNVHTVAPLNRKDARTWSAQFPGLARLVSQSPFPTVLAGDFNATLDHSPFDDLVSGDVRDAFLVGGAGWGSTWPDWGGLVPPLMRLDHVVVAGGVSVGSVTDHASVGSDHRRLVAELGVPSPGATSGVAHGDAAAAPFVGDGSNR